MAFDNQKTLDSTLQPEEWNNLLDLIPAGYVIYKKENTIYAVPRYGDGTVYSSTNAQEVFQNVINALTNGGLIFVKRGTYNFDAPIVIDKENILLIGENLETKIIYGGTDVAIRVKKSDGSSLYRFLVSNLYIEASNGNGIELYNCHWGEVRRCDIYNCNIGIYCYGAWESYLSYNVIRNCTTGIKLSGEVGKSCNHIRIFGNYLGNSINIEIDDTSQPASVKIEANNIADCSTAGIKITKRTRMLTIERNYFENNNGHCIHLAGESGALIRGTVISRNFFALNSGKTAIYADYCEGTWIEGNWCEGGSYFVYMTSHAIRLAGFGNKLYTPNHLTSEAIWKSDYFTEAVVYIPIVGELLQVTETSYTYKYYLFKLDTSKFESILEAKLEASMKSASGETVYVKLVKYDNGWVDVSGSEISSNAGGWVLVQSGDIKGSLYNGETDYMIMVRTTGGTSEIQRVALKIVLKRE